MTALADLLLGRIAATGPLTIAEYMQDCLLHPQHGYYTTQEPFGTDGDFTTAPEISQMFGELVGLALAQAWIERGRPSNALLVELGPGRGTLMRDALRAMGQVPGLSLRPYLIEASPRLRAQQAETLANYPVSWADSLSDLPPAAPVFVVANEFFDALPVRQFLRDGPGWRERLVGAADGKLTFGLGTRTELSVLDPHLNTTRDGDLVQLGMPGNAMMTHLAERIASQGGAALVFDYGSASALGDTLQAVRNHSKCPVLDAPGTADLTAHVDFAALAHAATSAGASATPALAQGVFLERLGLGQRAARLSQGKPEDQVKQIAAAYHRLTDPAEMGNLFKVMGVTRPQDPVLPGTV